MFIINVVIVTLCAIVVVHGEPTFHLDNHLADCGQAKNHTVCKCGREGEKFKIPISMCLAKDPVTGDAICEPCNKILFSNVDICEKYENCLTCAPGIDRCVTCPKGRHGPYCQSDVARNLENLEHGFEIGDRQLLTSLIFPIRVRIPRGAPIRDNRILRAPDACHYPTTLTTAEVDCTLYNNKVKCTEICVWGHTLPEGKTRDMQCRYENNTWTSDFEECKPFVDCTLKFKTPGDMFCVSNKLESPTTCELACNEYDEEPEVPSSNYECNLNGSWNPPLPFCVERGGEIQLVSAPH